MKKIIFILLFISYVLGQGNVRIVGRDSNNNSNFLKVQSDGSTDINVQDQTTDPIIFKFNKIDQSTTLAEATVLDQSYIRLSSMTGVDAGDYVIVFDTALIRFYKGNVLSTNGDTAFVDAPLDVAFNNGAFVDVTTTNMAVDGSNTIQTFGLRGVSPSPIGITVDITRIIIHCQTATAVDLSKFGDIVGGITNGLVLRTRNGRQFNIFNVKTNGEIASLAYDFDARASTNPNQGQDGFLSRLTFAGQNKMGVAIRLEPGFDLEFLVQDNLSTLTLLEVIAEGHIVED